LVTAFEAVVLWRKMSERVRVIKGVCVSMRACVGRDVVVGIVRWLGYGAVVLNTFGEPPWRYIRSRRDNVSKMT
jgi:hypothetical protein